MRDGAKKWLEYAKPNLNNRAYRPFLFYIREKYIHLYGEATQQS